MPWENYVNIALKKKYESRLRAPGFFYDPDKFIEV
jgi:hypothetical protein